MFDYVELKHIYRERNSLSDILAKEGAFILEGFWHIKEFQVSETYDTFHIF